MCRFIRITTAGCLLGLTMLFGTPAAQAKGHGGHGHSKGHSHGHSNHRGHHRGDHRDRYDRYYGNYRWYLPGYTFNYGCTCADEVPAAQPEECGCAPVMESGYVAGEGESYCGFHGYYKWPRDRYHSRHDRGHGRTGHGSGHGRK